MRDNRERAAANDIVPPAFKERRRAMLRMTPQAGFVSQILADAQVEHEDAPVASVLERYSRGAAIATRRLPPGYRRTVVV